MTALSCQKVGIASNAVTFARGYFVHLSVFHMHRALTDRVSHYALGTDKRHVLLIACNVIRNRTECLPSLLGYLDDSDQYVVKVDEVCSKFIPKSDGIQQ